MKKSTNKETINTVIGMADNPKSYAELLLSGNIRQKIDKRVCRTLYQLAGEFLMEQKINSSAYFISNPCLTMIENEREILARLRNLQHILTNRASALFYLNTQAGFNFGSFSDIDHLLSQITKRDYWFILQSSEWNFLLSALKSADVSYETKEKLKKIREAYSLHLYAFLVKKDSMFKEHLSIGTEHQIVEDMSQMGQEAVIKYLKQFDTTKPGNPYLNTHVVKNEINSKLNDYGQENRNDRVRRANWTQVDRVDYKSQLLRTHSIDEWIRNERFSEDGTAMDEAILEDKKSLEDFQSVEICEDFKRLYNSIKEPMERKILYRLYFEFDNWTQTTLAKDLHISPIKLKKLRKNIQKKAIDLGICLI